MKRKTIDVILGIDPDGFISGFIKGAFGAAGVITLIMLGAAI